MDDFGSCLLQVWFFPFHLLQVDALFEVGFSKSSKLVAPELQFALR
jgi:hypothetical protein